MNNAMIGGIARHVITLLAAAVIVSGPGTLDDAVKTLMNAIASGDINAIIGTTIVIASILWSMWAKMSEASKQTVIKTLTFRK
jgi:hypothetical protein